MISFTPPYKFYSGITLVIAMVLLTSFASLGQVQGGTGQPSKQDTTKMMSKLYAINDFMEWYMTWFPVPYGSYSKETSWLFGLSKFNAFTMDKGDTTDNITQPSSISAFGYYTLNNQVKTVLESNLMFNKNRALWKTDLIYSHYPLEYFGVGNDTQLENQRTLNTTNLQLETEFLWRLWQMWFAGLQYDFFNFTEVDLVDGSPPNPSDSIHLSHNLGIQSGLGPKILMEGRDNRLNAKSGYFVELGFQVYDELLGSEYNYSHLHSDFRYYITPFEKLTIAAQVRSEWRNGEVPVQSLSFIGGDYNMRGIYLGRYRDKVALDSQMELRFPIFWILGGVVFGGLGQVGPSYEQLALDRTHYNYGLGLRLQVDSEHDVNIRFDLGFSQDKVAFIMNFAEAF